METIQIEAPDELIAHLRGIPADWRQGKGVLITTARAFKELEADVVVLHDVGALSSYFAAFDLYVACTRARFMLIVLSAEWRLGKPITGSRMGCGAPRSA